MHCDNCQYPMHYKVFKRFLWFIALKLCQQLYHQNCLRFNSIASLHMANYCGGMNLDEPHRSI